MRATKFEDACFGSRIRRVVVPADNAGEAVRVKGLCAGEWRRISPSIKARIT
jgi:hypothetical protein